MSDPTLLWSPFGFRASNEVSTSSPCFTRFRLHRLQISCWLYQIKSEFIPALTPSFEDSSRWLHVDVGNFQLSSQYPEKQNLTVLVSLSLDSALVNPLSSLVGCPELSSLSLTWCMGIGLKQSPLGGCHCYARILASLRPSTASCSTLSKRSGQITARASGRWRPAIGNSELTKSLSAN